MPFITSIDLNSTALGLDMYREFVCENIHLPGAFLFTSNKDQILLILLTFLQSYLYPHLMVLRQPRQKFWPKVLTPYFFLL